MKANKWGELECECGGLYYSTSNQFHTGEYICDSCYKIHRYL